MKTNKIEKLKAIKEEFARTQARIQAVRKLEESAQESHLSTLLENDLEQAELVLAAQDIMNKLQNMAEDLAKMNAQDLFPLADKMKSAFGQEAAHAFEISAQEVVSQAMNAVRHAKDELGNSILRLEGKIPANDMAADASMDPGADMNAEPVTPTGGADLDAAMDDFGSADAAAGPVEEPLGRARKESVEATKTPLKESVILEAAGQKLIQTEGLESLIDWVLTEAAAGMPEEHFRTFAKSVATRAAKDPAKLAGWIGKKKHGMAAMAQLAEPTFTATPDLELVEGKSFKKNDDNAEDKKEKFTARKNARKEKQKGDDSLDEGKTFKRGEDADEDEDKKAKFTARKNARKEKHTGDDSLDEGKSFKKNDDDSEDKKVKFTARKNARKEKQKGDDTVTEATLVARTIASLIEGNLKKFGKGMAGKTVAEVANQMDSNSLVEGIEDTTAWILEAFTAEFGMSPAAYSIRKLRENTPPLSNQDKKVAAGVMGKIAGQMTTDKSTATKSVSTAMNGLTGQERTVANKMLNTMKKSGTAPKNVGDFATGASTMVGDDKQNEGLEENINAAHWPIDTMGQYKGEPFQTDYEKLKPNPKSAAKTEGGAPETKVEEPKVDGAKSGKSEGNPFAKKDEPKDEPKSEDTDNSEK